MLRLWHYHEKDGTLASHHVFCGITPHPLTPPPEWDHGWEKDPRGIKIHWTRKDLLLFIDKTLSQIAPHIPSVLPAFCVDYRSHMKVVYYAGVLMGALPVPAIQVAMSPSDNHTPITLYFSTTSVCFSYFWGWLSDVKGRRPVMIVSLASMAIVNIGFGFTTNITSAMILRLIAGTTNGLTLY